MGRIEKTVFISYRRTNAFGALAIFQDLTQHGYDVFLDYNGIPSGDFEPVILENIRARAHFLVLLTPSALERCSEPGDWLRREIETALDEKRNIVPLMLEGFDFSTPAIASQLTGKLALLRKYQALSVPVEYFAEAMVRLRTRYLNVALDQVSHPLSQTAQLAAEEQQSAAVAAPAVQESQLSAQTYFERAFDATTPEERIRFYTRTIEMHLQPGHTETRHNKGKTSRITVGAVALRRLLLVEAYNNRGNARCDAGDFAGATADFNEAIRLAPKGASALRNRGYARYRAGDFTGALDDYNKAIELRPGYANAYYNRARLQKAMGDKKAAISDFRKYLEIGGGEQISDRARVEQMIEDLEAVL